MGAVWQTRNISRVSSKGWRSGISGDKKILIPSPTSAGQTSGQQATAGQLHLLFPLVQFSIRQKTDLKILQLTDVIETFLLYPLPAFRLRTSDVLWQTIKREPYCISLTKTVQQVPWLNSNKEKIDMRLIGTDPSARTVSGL